MNKFLVRYDSKGSEEIYQRASINRRSLMDSIDFDRTYPMEFYDYPSMIIPEKGNL